jgi:tripartite-type tricarboxylate transporter receptor subunit TctC
MNDMVAGQIDLMVDSAPNSLPHVRAGSIKSPFRAYRKSL